MGDKDGDIRLGRLALEPLSVLHSEGWGPDYVETDGDEVRFVYVKIGDGGDSNA